MEAVGGRAYLVRGRCRHPH